MLRQLRSAVIAVVVLTIGLGLAYPLAITELGRLLWPHQAGGSQIERHGRVIGSSLIGQDFRGDPRYFQSRPSASGQDAAVNSASNLGPNSARLAGEMRARVHAYVRREGRFDSGLTAARVPVDAVTASGSGVDPDISLANATIQADRVATVRGLPLALVRTLIARHEDGLPGNVFGPISVNVLELNLALDAVRGR